MGGGGGDDERVLVGSIVIDPDPNLDISVCPTDG